MSELIKTLQLAIVEVESFGNSKAVRVIERALEQAYKISGERDVTTGSLKSNVWQSWAK
jgi:hypothetical protein|tara:strand:- start:759 stop:935 length:177 start_codon:yes stop_codon:yes gene_type:complete